MENTRVIEINVSAHTHSTFLDSGEDGSNSEVINPSSFTSRPDHGHEIPHSEFERREMENTRAIEITVSAQSPSTLHETGEDGGNSETSYPSSFSSGPDYENEIQHREFEEIENTRVIEINVSAHTPSTFLNSGEDGSYIETSYPSPVSSGPYHGNETPNSEFERREMGNTRAIEITVSAQSPSILHETGEDGSNSETSYPSSFSSGPDYENEIQHREFEEIENIRLIEINVSAHTPSTFLDSVEEGSYIETSYPSPVSSRPYHGNETPHGEFEPREMENTRVIEITVSGQSPMTLLETGEDGSNSEASYPSSFSSGPDYENEIQHREFEEIENTRVMEINVSAHAPSTFLDSGEDGRYIETSYPSPVSSRPYHGNETPHGEFERREMENTRVIEITVSGQSPMTLLESGEDGSNSEASYPSSFSSGPDYENEIQHREFEEIENTRVMEINVSAHAPSTFLDSGEDGRYIETSYPSPVSSRPYHGNETPHGEFERREMENTRVIEITVSGQSPMTLLETGEDGSNSEASYPSSFSSGPDYENEIQHREFEEIENTPVIEISVSAHAPSTYQDSGERGSYIGASNPSSFSSEPNIGNETPYGEFEQQEMGNTRNIERSLTSQWPSTFLPCEDGRIEASNLSSFSPGPDRGNETSLSELEQQKMVNDRVIEISVSSQSPSTFQSCEDGRIEASNPSVFSPGPDHGNETPYGEFEQQEMGNTRNIEISVSSQSPSTFLSCDDGRFEASNPSSFSLRPDHGNETPYGEFEQQKMVNDRVIEISVSSQSPSTFQSCEDGRIEASNPSVFSPGPDHGNETPYGEFEQQEMGNTRNIEISVSSQSPSTFLSCDDGRFEASNPSSFSLRPDHGNETPYGEFEQQKMVNDRVIEISVSTQSPSTFQSCEDGRIEASNPSSFSPGPDHGNETPYGEFEQQEMGNTRNIEISVSSQSPSTFLSCEDGRFQASNPSSFSPGPDQGNETPYGEFEQQEMGNTRNIEISVSSQSPSTFLSCEDGRFQASNPSSFSPGPDQGNETPYGEFEQQEMGNTRNIEISVSSQSSSTFLSCEDGRFQASNPSSFSPGPDHGYETSLSELEQQKMVNDRVIEISVSTQSPSTFQSCEDGRIEASNPSSFSPGPDHGNETPYGEFEQQEMGNTRNIEISVSSQSSSTFLSCEDGRFQASNPSSFSPGPDHGYETSLSELEQQKMVNDRVIEISVSTQSPSTFQSCEDGRIEASNPSSFSPGPDHGNETPYGEFEQQEMGNTRNIEISVSSQSPSTFLSCEDDRFEASNPSSFSPGPDHGNETPYGEFEQQEMGNTRNIEISVSSQSPSTFLSCEDGRFEASNPSSFSPGPDHGYETSLSELEQQKMVNDRVIEISVSTQSPSTFQSCEDGRIEASNPSSFSPGPDHGNETPYGEFEQQEMGNTRNIEISVSSQSSSTFLSCEDGRFQASNPSSFSPGPDHGYETSLSELEQQKMVNDRVIEISVSSQSPSTFQSCEDGRIEASNPSSFSPGPDHGNETPYGEFEQQEMGNTRNIEISVSSQSPSTFLSCEDGRFEASNPSSFSPGPDHGNETPYGEFEQQEMGNTRNIEISVTSQSPSTFLSCDDGRIEASNPSSFSPGLDHGNETPLSEFEEQEQREQQERENFLDLSINISSLSTSQDNGGDDSNSEASHSWTLIEIPANLDRTGSSVLEDTSEQDIANLNITIPPTPPSTSDSNITMVEKEDKIIGITYTWVLTPIPERRLRTTDIAFKIHSTIFEDKIIYCVNFTPFGHVLLFSLNKLVNYFFPWSDVTICAKILQEHLNIPLYRGNSEQIELLHRYHIISSLVPDDSPLVLLQDLYDHICELKRKIK